MDAVGLQLLSWFLVVDPVQYLGLHNVGAIHVAHGLGAHTVNSFQQHDGKMISESIGKHTIQRTDDINELLVYNYNLFNEYALYDAEVGHTMEAVARHFQRLDLFLANKKMEEALQARKNQNQAFFHIFNHNNFPALQWGVLLQSIDGVRITDYSVDAVKKLVLDLSAEGLTQGKILNDVEAAKKKSAHN